MKKYNVNKIILKEIKLKIYSLCYVLHSYFHYPSQQWHEKKKHESYVKMVSVFDHVSDGVC